VLLHILVTIYLNETNKILLSSTAEFKNGGAITPVNIYRSGALFRRIKEKAIFFKFVLLDYFKFVISLRPYIKYKNIYTNAPHILKV
jgi:hypothetical protein